jgi:hypothetical protein
MKKAKQKRKKEYEKPLVIDGTFSQVIRVALGKKEEVKKEREAAKKK